ncbi:MULTISPECIES: adenosine kinase [Psychrobacter]|uniref:adenosine kinase n=1 Tax=Psychrobacter TaxID=497 RepID=UPI00086F8DAB|nr:MULTISPECIES: adenosine kinase [Psychrobacter]MBA6244229.1 adenosine kinase [Psychrobacter sp. Urea-trap-18]MBA6286637.1 adenosine kinase [Psychrobacter sp. Urea-trap-16]MBA6317634.1 adenosine kinase [Psychrobacter sp. Urea-trap-20]MBA6334258.1 adenosine kinase [Psychrobacter sp. Urea-trap-19]OEH67529.1 MAG: adenosine kinase [Psychrobacter sp. B29-1]|tara:strand:- start:63612 stop:64631 length:1020 start_codon:yes stop_codon:yes gene_type:complete
MYDVMAIGNALVDHEYVLSDAALEETELTKGNMTLAGIEEQQQLLAYFKLAEIEPSKQAGGGSAANTMFTFASLGGKPFYACRVGDDDQGAFYLRDLHEAGVATSDKSIHADGVTGSCVVAVTEDGERTMQTYLGTSSEIAADNIDFDALTQADWLYIEGYLAMSESIQPAMTQLRQQAGIHNAKIAVSFADPAVVKFAKDGLLNMLGNKVAVIFCNSEEAKLFTDKKQVKAAARALLEYCQIAVVTDGANGAVIAHQPNDEAEVEVYDVATPAVANVIDTNGAGDNYAGAFLYALSQQYSLPECGRLASEISAQVIQQFGPRLASQDYRDIAQRVLSS